MTEPDRLDVESRRLRSALEAWFGCGRTKDKASLDALRAAAVRWLARVDEADRERPKDVSAFFAGVRVVRNPAVERGTVMVHPDDLSGIASHAVHPAHTGACMHRFSWDEGIEYCEICGIAKCATTPRPETKP